MSAQELKSPRVEANDTIEAIELCYQKGWTDGLPVIPPVESRVREMVEYAGLEPDAVIGTFPLKQRVVTVEKAAINAVMAGCLPAYFPVVVAAVQCVLHEPDAVHGMAASTSSPAPLLVVNGPIRQQIGINCGGNVFGPGWRANATIGRALRLIMINVLAATPNIFDRGTLGLPEKYTYCIGEDEENSPWEPLHVERGFEREASTLTLISAEAPRQITNRTSNSPEGILLTVADTMKCGGASSFAFTGREYVVVIAREHQDTIAAAGWTKNQVKQFLFENARRNMADLKRLGVRAGEIEPGDEQKIVTVVAKPEDIIVIAAGGAGGRYSACIPCSGGLPSVTKVIGACADCK